MSEEYLRASLTDGLLFPDLTVSHEQGLQNAIDILGAEGKLTGITPTNFISASIPKVAL